MPDYQARIWEAASRYRWSLFYRGEFIAGGTKSTKTRQEAVTAAKVARDHHQQDTPVEFVSLDDD